MSSLRPGGERILHEGEPVSRKDQEDEETNKEEIEEKDGMGSLIPHKTRNRGQKKGSSEGKDFTVDHSLKVTEERHYRRTRFKVTSRREEMSRT